jgi:hypothetical protein
MGMQTYFEIKGFFDKLKKCEHESSYVKTMPRGEEVVKIDCLAIDGAVAFEHLKEKLSRVTISLSDLDRHYILAYISEQTGYQVNAPYHEDPEQDFPCEIDFRERKESDVHSFAKTLSLLEVLRKRK